ncbi:hypothetical protein BHE74_00050904 [Ensete ventricosum]|nr:hypothetical protein GW17_00030691 [Ensete ventricosum]RWW43435.1 hypothetical protein BHE74_00050904 [Ensete ventricosum]RZR81840.1 hypothetical protein BHM03_00008143 [Ensete ventricosum]
MERHDLTLASTRVHVLDLQSKESLMPLLHVPSSTSTPFMWFGYFTKFYPSCSAPRFALS